MVLICLKRDLGMFVALASYGAISVGILSIVVIGVGILSFTNTDFQFLKHPGIALDVD
jgi:hypothetical protein